MGKQYINGYRVSISDPKFNDGLALVRLVNETELDNSEGTLRYDAKPLGGRGNIFHSTVPGYGKVVIKPLVRGGVLGRLIKRHYLFGGEYRPEAECELLSRAAKLGVNIPEPVGAVVQGRAIYKGWIILREIPDHRSLTDLYAIEDEGLIRAVILDAARQVKILIENGILHVDLHPGNVVVDGTGKVYLLDFDKAHLFSGDAKHLRDLYLSRWRRAIIKHNLSDVLIESFSLGLRMHGEIQHG